MKVNLSVIGYYLGIVFSVGAELSDFMTSESCILKYRFIWSEHNTGDDFFIIILSKRMTFLEHFLCYQRYISSGG
jgi:hypothetical protein